MPDAVKQAARIANLGLFSVSCKSLSPSPISIGRHATETTGRRMVEEDADILRVEAMSRDSVLMLNESKDRPHGRLAVTTKAVDTGANAAMTHGVPETMRVIQFAEQVRLKPVQVRHSCR